MTTTRAKIERNLLDKTASEWSEKSEAVQNKSMYGKRSERQALFDKNYITK